MPSFIIWFHSDSFFLPALLHVSLFLLLLFYVFFYVDVVRSLRPTYDRYHKYMEERDLPDENSQPPERDPTCIGFESTRARLEDHICNLERSCLAVEDAAAYVLCSGGAARASRRRTSGSPGTAGAGCASASWELSPPTSVDIARDPEFQRKMKTVDYFFSLTRQESLTLDEDHWIDADDADAPAGYGRAVDASK